MCAKESGESIEEALKRLRKKSSEAVSRAKETAITASIKSKNISLMAKEDIRKHRMKY